MHPEYADRPAGETIVINGVPMTHLGGGRFQAQVLGDVLAKRFDVGQDEPLHLRVA